MKALSCHHCSLGAISPGCWRYTVSAYIRTPDFSSGFSLGYSAWFSPVVHYQHFQITARSGTLEYFQMSSGELKSTSWVKEEKRTLTGAHQMEPPSPIQALGVNPLPSRFIIRTIPRGDFANRRWEEPITTTKWPCYCTSWNSRKFGVDRPNTIVS